MKIAAISTGIFTSISALAGSLLSFLLLLISPPPAQADSTPMQDNSELVLQIDFPKLTCTNSKVQEQVTKACNAIGNNLSAERGPWGFGLFHSFVCSNGDFSKGLFKKNKTFILRMDWQQTYTVATLYFVVVGKSSITYRPESVVRIPANPYQLDLLANSKIARLVAAEILDRAPFQAPAQLLSASERKLFPKEEPAFGTLKKHSSKDIWKTSAIDFDTQKEAWVVSESDKNNSTLFQNTRWWSHSEKRGLRASEIKTQRDLALLAETEKLERDLMSQSPEKMRSKRKFQETTNLCTGRTMALTNQEDPITLSASETTSDKIDPGNHHNHPWNFTAFGGLQPARIFANNAYEGGVQFSPGPVSGFSNLVASWSYLKIQLSTKLDYRLLDNNNTVAETERKVATTNYSRQRYTLGYSTVIPAGKFALDAQLNFSLLRQQATLTSDLTNTIFIFKPANFPTLGLLLGFSKADKFSSWAIQINADAGIQSRLAQQEVALTGWWQLSVPKLLRSADPPVDYRVGPFTRTNFIRIVSATDTDSGTNYHEIKTLTTTFGGIVAVEW